MIIIVVGALGLETKGLEKCLEELGIRERIESIHSVECCEATFSLMFIVVGNGHRTEFKSRTRLFAFHMALIPL